jgi:DNA-binding NtrC family response regulator
MRVLWVDDQHRDYPALPAALHGLGIELACEAEAMQALDRIASDGPYDALLLDLLFPGQPVSGAELFAEVRQRWPGLPVVIMTGRDSLSAQQDFLRAGAAGYLFKSAESLTAEHLSAAVTLAVEHVRWRQLLERTPDAGVEPAGQCPVFLETLRRLRQGAAGTSCVALIGDTGSGRTFLGHWLHRQSPQRGGPLVTLHARDATAATLESDLFGGERPGLLELAAGGMLLIEEAEDLPGHTQAMLRETLESRQVRRPGSAAAHRLEARLVFAATPGGTELLEQAGLYVVPIPSLAERREDIPLLARHFLDRFAAAQGTPPLNLTPAAVTALTMSAYPSNIAGLRTVVDRAAANASGGRIDAADLGVQRTAQPYDTERRARSLLDGKSALTVFGELDDAFDRLRDREFVAIVSRMVALFRQQQGRAPHLQELFAKGCRPEDLPRVTNRITRRLIRAGIPYSRLLAPE